VTKFITKELAVIPKMVNPVLIEGLPGIGNVARLCVDYLVDKLKAKKFLELFSDSFPNSVMINDDSLIKMFNLEFFHVKVEGRDLIFLAGDVQPTSDAESYALCQEVVALLKEWGVKEVVTIGGIGLPEAPDKARVHAVVNDLVLKDSLKGLKVIFDGSETVKIILGVTGLLLGVAGLNGLKGFSLLVETLNDPQHVGIKESREVLKLLVEYLGISLDFAELNEEIKSFEQEIKEESRITRGLDKPLTQGYIG